MGIAKNPQQGTGPQKPVRWLSFGMTYAEHAKGEKATTSSTPIGACFRERVKGQNSDEKDTTNYLFQYEGKIKYGYAVYGKLSSIKRVTKKMKDVDVPHISFMLDDNDEKINLALPLYTSKGKINTLVFEMVSTLLSASEYGIVIFTPYMRENKSLKIGDKFVTPQQLKEAGITNENWGEWVDKFPKAKEDVRNEAKISIDNVIGNFTETLNKMNQSLKNVKTAETKLKQSVKMSDLPPALIVKIMDGEETEINNSKKRNKAYEDLIEQLISKYNSLKPAKSEPSSVPQTETHQEEELSESSVDEEAYEDDLPF